MNFHEKNDKIWENVLAKFLDFQSIQNQFFRKKKVKNNLFDLEDSIFVTMFLLYRPNCFTK